jgi:hypothetical protein
MMMELMDGGQAQDACSLSEATRITMLQYIIQYYSTAKSDHDAHELQNPVDWRDLKTLFDVIKLIMSTACPPPPPCPSSPDGKSTTTEGQKNQMTKQEHAMIASWMIQIIKDTSLIDIIKPIIDEVLSLGLGLGGTAYTVTEQLPEKISDLEDAIAPVVAARIWDWNNNNNSIQDVTTFFLHHGASPTLLLKAMITALDHPDYAWYLYSNRRLDTEDVDCKSIYDAALMCVDKGAQLTSLPDMCVDSLYHTVQQAVANTVGYNEKSVWVDLQVDGNYIPLLLLSLLEVFMCYVIPVSEENVQKAHSLGRRYDIPIVESMRNYNNRKRKKLDDTRLENQLKKIQCTLTKK